MTDPNCAKARRLLEDIRRNRRSQSPSGLASAATLLGCTIETTRGKGSHWWARKPGAPRFSIPTGRDPVSIGVTTVILRYLEEVYDDVCGN